MSVAQRAVLLAVLAIGCGSPKPKSPGSEAFSGPTHACTSTAGQRKDVAITVYNHGFGLVREVRQVDLAEGRVSLEFRDVAAHVQPETVHLKSLDDPAAITIFEQDYRYDLLTPEKLLEKYVGKTVRLYRWNEKLGAEEAFDAEVLSIEGGSPVYRIGGEVTYGFPGRVGFPEVPANLIAKPTLVWLLGSTRPKQTLEVTYLTSGISWHADYVLVLGPNDDRGDLTAWVTLENGSGAAYENATLKLVAGDVNKVQPVDAAPMAYDDVAAEVKAAEAAFTEEGLFEYHLYTLGRPTTLLQNEQKQVTLLEAQGVAVEKKLVFGGRAWWYHANYGQVASNQKVSVFLDLKNDAKNGLGVPMPKGVVRVYKSDASGAQQFVGEDVIDHTPRDEEVRVKMGEAFDVVGDRTQASWSPIGDCASETSWEIKLRNHKDVPVAVEVVEPVDGDWEIVSSSQPWTKKDARTFTFDAKVPANGETKLAYRVRVKWC